VSHAPVETSHYTGIDLKHAEGTKELNRQVDEGTSWSGNERNQVFLNLGERNGDQELPRFADISAVTGFDLPDDSRGLVSLDWDQDGDLDFITTNRTAPRVRIFENRLPVRPDSSILIKLTGTKTNRDAIGSRVTLALEQGGKAIEIQRALRAGEGFLSQSSKWLHFGIPKNATISNLTVHWFGQDEQIFTGIKPGKSFELIQGNETAQENPRIPISSPSIRPHDEGINDTTIAHLERPLPLPRILYQTLDGAEKSISYSLDKPAIINLWATWCPDCLNELQEFSEKAETFRAAGFNVLALCVDIENNDSDTLAKAREILKKINFPFEAGIATTKTLELIHLSHNTVFIRPAKLPVPTTLILAPGAKLHTVVRGPTTVAELAPAMAAISGDWKMFARPAGPGIWLHGPDTVPYSSIAKELLERGWLDDAASFLLDQKNDLIADGKIYPELLMAVGTKVLANKEIERGISLLKSAVEAAPELAAAQNNLAVAYLQTGRSDEAAPHLEAALAIDPNFLDARLNLARYHLGIKDPKSAQALIAPVLTKGYHPKAIRLQAQIHVLQQDYTSLLTVFQTITLNEPTDPTAWINLGKLQQQMKQPAAALEAYGKAVQLLPQNEQLKVVMKQLRESATK
jgi:thioredoxin-like negative regulator of GroEL